MNYGVRWSPAAEQELAALWLDSTQRQAVTRAAHVIDQLLQVDAHEQGESREGDTRILIESPLVVLFHVFQAERQTLVVRVWKYGKE